MGHKTDLHTKFQPNRTILAEVIRFQKFSAGRQFGLACIVGFQKNLWLHSALTKGEYLKKIKLISQGNKKISTTKSQNISILKNLYKTLFWLVGPKKLTWFDKVP